MTKRYTLLLCCLVLSTGLAWGQASLTAKAGTNVTSYKIEHTFGNEVEQFAEPGLLAGVAITLPWQKAPWLALQPELLYVQKRHSMQTRGTMKDFNTEVVFPKQGKTLHYLEVPLLLKATQQKGLWQGYVAAGPALGYALAGRYSSGNQKGDYNFENSRRLETSVQAGAGLGKQLANGTLLLEVRYIHGLTHLQKATSQAFTFSSGTDTWQHVVQFPADQKSRVISLSLGYAFAWGGPR